MKIIFLRLLQRLGAWRYRNLYQDISQRDENRDLFESEIVREVSWPRGARAVFNLQFDDFCAKSKENGPYDFGGTVGAGINLLFDKILQKYPFLKITLFVIPEPGFKNYRGIYYGDTGERFNLSRPEYQALICWLKTKSGQVEVAGHGLSHLQHQTKFFLNFAEFEFASEAESARKIERAAGIFKKIGLKPKGFKPPGWGIGENNDFHFLEALRKQTFSYVCLSSPFSGLNYRLKKVSNLYPQYYGTMLNLPQNVSLAWDLPRLKRTIDRLVEANGIITLMGHYNTEDDWMADGLGPKNLQKLDEIISYLKEKYPEQIWWATLGEIADFWHTKHL